MHDVLPAEIVVPLQHLGYYLGGVALGQLLPLLDVLVQAAVRAVLEDQVVEVRRLDDLVQPEDVVVHQVPVDLDLSLQHLET